MVENRVSRRRFLQISAAVGAAPLHSAIAGEATEWQGTALGADARILLEGRGRVPAQTVIAECIAEIERLDRIFSLYRTDSEISMLNASGAAQDVSLDFREVLSASADIHRVTFGLFDPTVQPLWRLYAEWYTGRPQREHPPEAVIRDLQACIGLDRVDHKDGAIRLPHGAALTFNGIAQGYITDRITDILRARGWRHVLSDIGEIRAIGGREDDQPFTVRVRESGLSLPVTDTALATSSAGALMFAPREGLAHIIHPRTGLTESPWRCVTVRHASAMVADALSTALVLAPAEAVPAIVRNVGDATAWMTSPHGSTAIFEG